MRIWWFYRFMMEGFLFFGATFYFVGGQIIVYFSWRICDELPKTICKTQTKKSKK